MGATFGRTVRRVTLPIDDVKPPTPPPPPESPDKGRRAKKGKKDSVEKEEKKGKGSSLKKNKGGKKGDDKNMKSQPPIVNPDYAGELPKTPPPVVEVVIPVPESYTSNLIVVGLPNLVVV